MIELENKLSMLRVSEKDDSIGIGAKKKISEMNQFVKSNENFDNSYIPPHLRRMGSDPVRKVAFTLPLTGFNGGRNEYYNKFDGHQNSRFPINNYYGKKNGYTKIFKGNNNFTYGYWKNGKHFPHERNDAMELELFGSKYETEQKISGINFDSYDDIPVEVTGNDPPEPINEFTSPPLNLLLEETIKLAPFSKPTPVQRYSIPIVINGRDIMACAQTGSGKTAAFLFPVLSNMFDQGPSLIPDNMKHSYSRKVFPTAIVLAPTRELATQIFEESKKFSYRSWVKPFVVYGGTDVGTQLRGLSKGCDFIIATPGRLNDILERGKISLVNVKYLILDEADRMLDMGFEPQIRNIVENHDMPSAKERTTLLFSATFPKDIQYLARDFLNDYLFLSIGRVGSTSENISQNLIYVEEFDKKSILLDLLSNVNIGPTLVFVETKRMANELTEFLISQKCKATAIHGDRSQIERERALSSFRTGNTNILVATAVAARGLDIPTVTHVVNYDLPNDIDDYVHRIGRTGRAGNIGASTSFFNRSNKNIARSIVQILMETNQEIPLFLKDISKESSGSIRSGRGGKFIKRGRFQDYNSNNYRGSKKKNDNSKGFKYDSSGNVNVFAEENNKRTGAKWSMTDKKFSGTTSWW